MFAKKQKNSSLRRCSLFVVTFLNSDILYFRNITRLSLDLSVLTHYRAPHVDLAIITQPLAPTAQRASIRKYLKCSFFVAILPHFVLQLKLIFIFFSNFMILKFIEKISWQGTHGVLLDSFVVFVLNANEGFQTKMSQCHVFVSRLRPPCSSCYINDFQQGLWIGTGFSNVF